MRKYNSLDVRVVDNVAEICFGAGERGNALTELFWKEMRDALAEAGRSPDVRAALLYSKGRHYCSGIDTGFFSSLIASRGDDPARSMERLRAGVMSLQETFNEIENCRVPVLTAVQGACMGAGVDMVAACDLIYVSHDAYFSIHETNIGLAADLGSLQRLPRRMPFGLVRELAYTGRRLLSEEAVDSGFAAASLSDHAAAVSHARDIARTIASKSPLAILGTKRALQLSETTSVRDGLDSIASWNAGLSSIADIAESIASAKSGKPATYKPLLD